MKLYFRPTKPSSSFSGRLLLLLAVGLVMGLAVTPGSAEGTIYTDKATFLAALNDSWNYTFHLPYFPITPPYPYVINSSGAGGTVTASFTVNSVFGGDIYGALTTSVPTATITEANSGVAVNALGVVAYTSDINGTYIAGTINVTFKGSGWEQSFSLAAPDRTAFVGLTSPDGPITSVTYGAVQPGSDRYPSISELVFGTHKGLCMPWDLESPDTL